MADYFRVLIETFRQKSRKAFHTEKPLGPSMPVCLVVTSRASQPVPASLPEAVSCAPPQAW